MGRKREANSIRDAKGDPGKRAPARRPRTGAKTTKARKAAAGPTAEKGSTVPMPGTKPTTPKPADLVATVKAPGGAPRELTKSGKAVWNIIAPLLAKSNFYHPTYRLSLTRYCDTIAEYWKVTRHDASLQSFVHGAGPTPFSLGEGCHTVTPHFRLFFGRHAVATRFSARPTRQPVASR